MKKILLYSALAASSILMFSACNDPVGNEQNHSLFKKAESAEASGKYEEAGKCYEEFLMNYPSSSLTHLALGMLYKNHLDDPLKAVYHFEKWLTLNPHDTNNYEEIRYLAKQCRYELFKKLCTEYKNDPSLKNR